MRNLKFILGFAGTGFFLSLFFGIFSHSTFGRVFLQAVIFLILFGLIGFIIKFIYDKFLSDGYGTSESIDSSETSGSHKGTHVDLVVQDEELPTSESENRFYVGDNHQMLNESDFKVLRSNANGNFVPMQKESFDNISGTEAVTREEFKKRSEDQKSSFNGAQLTDLTSGNSSNSSKNDMSAANKDAAIINKSNSTESGSKMSSASSDGNELDTLPDMNDFSFGSQEDGKEQQDSASGFGTPTYTPSTGKSKIPEGIDPSNASLMAKAISSILSGES